MVPQKPRILLVDDSACFRAAARELLECRGYVVAGEADCAAAALRAVAALEPDAVLLDVRLPDGNGVELARKLQTQYPRLAILLVSAEPLTDGRLRSGLEHPFAVKADLASLDLSRVWPAPAAVAHG